MILLLSKAVKRKLQKTGQRLMAVLISKLNSMKQVSPPTDSAVLCFEVNVVDLRSSDPRVGYFWNILLSDRLHVGSGDGEVRRCTRWRLTN